MADEAFEMLKRLTGNVPDFSAGSLRIVEVALAQASLHTEDLSEDDAFKLVQRMGCYILEVGRREFGGTYQWYAERAQPVLVIGEPDFQVALTAWDKVRVRLAGDKAANIPVFFEGFAQSVRGAKKGTLAIFA